LPRCPAGVAVPWHPPSHRAPAPVLTAIVIEGRTVAEVVAA